MNRGMVIIHFLDDTPTLEVDHHSVRICPGGVIVQEQGKEVFYPLHRVHQVEDHSSYSLKVE